MSRVNPLKRAWIWCRRFRHRCGYGVHSPFAFNLITWVIYEKAPFYAYKDLDKLGNSFPFKGKDKNDVKVDRLLFRLVNEMQPENMLEIGTRSGLSTLYLSAAKRDAVVVTLDMVESAGKTLFSDYDTIKYRTGDLAKLIVPYLESVPHADFVHFNTRKPEARLFEQLLSQTCTHSLFVIEGINDSKAMKEWWQRLVADERTGVTFDLYDLGLIFFDKTKIKQHYIVNF